MTGYVTLQRLEQCAWRLGHVPSSGSAGRAAAAGDSSFVKMTMRAAAAGDASFVSMTMVAWRSIALQTAVKHRPLPTLVVSGDRDPLVSEYRLRITVAGVAQITLVRIDGPAHAVSFSHPVELASVVRLYLNDQALIDDPSAGGAAEQRTEEEYRHGR